MTVLIYALVIAIGALAVITNGTLLIILVRDPLHFFKSTTTYFIISLSVADMVTGANACLLGVNFFQPDLLRYHTDYLLALFWITIQASFLTLLAMSAERFLIVRYPFDCRRWITKKRVCLSIALIWLVSVTLGGPILLPYPQKFYVQFSIFTEFFVSVFVIIALYATIIIRVKQSKKALRHSKWSDKSENAGNTQPVGSTTPRGHTPVRHVNSESRVPLVSTSTDENANSETITGYTASQPHGGGTTAGNESEVTYEKEGNTPGDDAESSDDEIPGGKTPGEDGSSTGETMKDRTPEDKTSDGEISEGKDSSEDITSGVKYSQCKTSEDKGSEGETSEGEKSEDKGSECKTSEGKTSESKTSENKTSVDEIPVDTSAGGKVSGEGAIADSSQKRNGCTNAEKKYWEPSKPVNRAGSVRSHHQLLTRTRSSRMSTARKNKQEKKLTIVVLILVGVLIVTILPYLLVSQIYVGYILFCKCVPLSGLDLFMSIYFPIEILNFAVNPLIYAWRLPQYRRTLRYMFACGKARKKLRAASLQNASGSRRTMTMRARRD